jgi:hypothetical protein
MPKPEQPHSTTQGAHSGAQRPVLIYRQVSFSLEAFDRLKAWQRRLELAGGRPLTNGEVLDALILAVPLP